MRRCDPTYKPGALHPKPFRLTIKKIGISVYFGLTIRDENGNISSAAPGATITDAIRSVKPEKTIKICSRGPPKTQNLYGRFYRFFFFCWSRDTISFPAYSNNYRIVLTGIIAFYIRIIIRITHFYWFYRSDKHNTIKIMRRTIANV